MGVMTTALTTLNNVKTVTGVSGSAYDDLLSLLINRTSMAVKTYLARQLARATRIEEIAPSARQLLLLNEWPILSVTSITCDGIALVKDQDYRMDAQDAAIGALYKENGWATSYLVRGVTQDPVSAMRSIRVEYVAGYYLPSDPEYIEGADASLPIDIQSAVDDMIAEQFLRIKTKSQGLSSYAEGDISMSWKDPSSGTMLGMSDEHAAILNAYKRWSVG